MEICTHRDEQDSLPSWRSFLLCFAIVYGIGYAFYGAFLDGKRLRAESRKTSSVVAMDRRH